LPSIIHFSWTALANDGSIGSSITGNKRRTIVP
jgi:hypothetical protein